MGKQPQHECGVCFQAVGLNLSTMNGEPRIDTHNLRSGEDCPGSRTWVSRRTWDVAKAKAEGRVLHCWEDGPRADDGTGSTCMLEALHHGPHQWTSDNLISIGVSFGGAS